MSTWRRGALAVIIRLLPLALAGVVLADGKMVGPREYKGVPYEQSPQEQMQEAIIIFREGTAERSAEEDLILRITVEGDVDRFAWVIPFPNPPEVKEEKAQLFAELYDYVRARRRPRYKEGKSKGGLAKADAKDAEPVEVLSRKVVGAFDVAVVREKTPGALNEWLLSEGYQELEAAEDVLGFYREKGYVYACIKVAEAELEKGSAVDLHPLRFSFATGGRDGIFFPMKMTGLQEDRFDVNLYVFYGAWLNDHINRYGYENWEFELSYRDHDTPRCEPNAGKSWWAPHDDPLLESTAERMRTVTELFQRLHPGRRFYLTNLQARRLRPGAVRKWPDDLWLFPYYTNPDVVPYDAAPAGVAAAAYTETAVEPRAAEGVDVFATVICVVAAVAVVAVIAYAAFRRRAAAPPPPE